MTDTTNLTNHFLIAMPQLADPNFFQTVTYICEHNEEGAMGIIINRPVDISLGEILEHMDISAEPSEHTKKMVYMGGPVQPERGFVLHKPHATWDSTLPITDHISITTSRDILLAIAKQTGPEQYLIALGYAGWGAGQLEREIVDNAWLSGPADDRILFDLPNEQRWSAAAALLGVDLNLISGRPGHA